MENGTLQSQDNANIEEQSKPSNLRPVRIRIIDLEKKEPLFRLLDSNYFFDALISIFGIVLGIWLTLINTLLKNVVISHWYITSIIGLVVITIAVCILPKFLAKYRHFIFISYLIAVLIMSFPTLKLSYNAITTHNTFYPFNFFLDFNKRFTNFELE